MINMFFAKFIFGDGTDRAGIFTGDNGFDNGTVRADVMAAAAIDAFGGVDFGAFVNNVNCFFRAIQAAGLCQTAAALIADDILLAFAGSAGNVNYRNFAFAGFSRLKASMA